MNSKTFGLFAFAVFALVLVAGTASAAITLNPTSYSASINQGSSNSFVFTIYSDGVCSSGNCTLVNITATPSDLISGSNTLSSSHISMVNIPSSIAPNSTSSPITVSISIPSNQVNGTYVGSITVGGVNNETSGSVTARTISLSITVTSNDPAEITACSSEGNPGNIEVKKIDFTNNGMSNGVTFGKDDEWFPLENIQVNIDVKNLGNAADDKVNDITVNWGLWDTDARQWVIEPVDEKSFDLKSGKTNSLSVDFGVNEKDLDVDLTDLTDGDHYRFYVFAEGKVDDGNDTVTCAIDSKDAAMVIESDFVVLDNIQYSQPAQCGSSVDVTADVWNIGDNDEDDVAVEFISKDMALDQKVSIGSIDSLDKKKLTFTFNIPSNLTEKTYALTAQVLNEDGDVFQDDFNDDYAEFTLPLQVQGNCLGSTSPVAITANLVSGGQAGQDLVVGATLINSGSSTATYTVSASGQGQWATSYTVNPSSLTLAAGQSGDATFTFKVSNDVSGEQTFYIEAVSGNQVERQQVSVMIQPAGFLSSITGSATGGTGAILAGLGVLVLILLAVVIVMAIRVARK
jgi:hypothetical protein